MPVAGVVCRRSVAPDHPRLKVTYSAGRPKPRKASVISCAIAGVDFRVFQNSIDAAVCAVKERVLWQQDGDGFVQPIRPTESPKRRLAPFRRFVARHSSSTTPMTAVQFAQSYQGRRRVMYQRAVEDLEVRPFRSKDAWVKAFLKYEKYNFKWGRKHVVPRVISPRGPRYTVALGRYIKPIEKRLFSIVNTKLSKYPSILKGYNAAERGRIIADKWQRFHNPVAIGLDATKFDRHVSRDMLEFEHSIYTLFYPGCDELRSLLKLQLNNRVSMWLPDGRLRYTTDGTRMSGDMNTSLGNCVISVAILYCFLKEYNIPAEICNDGDDSVIITERRYTTFIQNNLNTYFERMGFLLVVEEPIYVLEKLVFCQCQPVKISGDYLMVRDPRVSLSKDSVCLLDVNNPKIFKGWLTSVGECGLSLCGGLPVLQAFYLCFMRNGAGGRRLRDTYMEGGMAMLSRNMARKAQPVDDDTRYSFWLAFDIDPAEQHAIEDYYDQLTISPVSQCDYVVHAQLPLEPVRRR